MVGECRGGGDGGRWREGTVCEDTRKVGPEIPVTRTRRSIYDKESERYGLRRKQESFHGDYKTSGRVHSKVTLWKD